MSIEIANLQTENVIENNPCAGIKHILSPKEKDTGDFSVRRVLPSNSQRMVGPWIFFDHMGPADFKAGQGINVRPHPHVNLATVTYLFEGEVLHRDSLGNELTIEPGAINLMVAGKGIVHSEREREEVRSKPHRLHGLQLWLALPKDMEEIDPAFYHYEEASIPTTTINGVHVRVMMGKAYGVTSPVKTFAHTLYVEADMKAGQTLELPKAEERAVYVAKGSVQARTSKVETFSMAIFENVDSIVIQAQEDSRIAIIGGENIGERHIYWNFVSSRKERIEQAKVDWETGKFPKVPGDEDEFIPLP
jgi:redox-sensitive bicupin YhaK (pirin superfamily)